MTQKYIGVTLPIRLGNNGMFEQSTDLLQQVRSNFKNLILTRKGERVMQPEFGCDLHTLLFQQIDDDMEFSVRNAVTSAVDRWLPYLEVIDLVVQMNADNDPYKIGIVVDYRFRNNPNVTDSIAVLV